MIRLLYNGIIDIDSIQQQVELKERKKYLEMHKYKIWQGANGFWYTYTKDRKLVKKKSKRDFENVVIRAEIKRIKEHIRTYDHAETTFLD